MSTAVVSRGEIDHRRRQVSKLTLPGDVFAYFQVLADLVSLYFVAVTVGAAAWVAFITLESMLDSAEMFPGEQALPHGTKRKDELQVVTSRKSWCIPKERLFGAE